MADINGARVPDNLYDLCLSRRTAAVNAGKMPIKLYELCLSNIVCYLQHSKCDRNELHSIPDSILMDLYHQMCNDKKLCVLGSELSNLDIFERLLKFTGAQQRLIQCFQAVIIEHGSNLSGDLARTYMVRCNLHSRDTTIDIQARDRLIHMGLRLGGFLNDAGWYADAEKVLLACRDLCQSAPQTTHYVRLTLECCHRLLNTQAAYCCFPGAAETFGLALTLLGLEDERARSSAQAHGSHAELCEGAALSTAHVPKVDLETCLESEIEPPPALCSVEGMENLLPRLYKEFSRLFFVRCDYNGAYKWSTEALKLLKPSTPPKIVVEVLRACGKACVVKRRFARAGLLMRQAVGEARRAFGSHHPRYAFALLDYGFYLLNIDSILLSVTVYEEALSSLRRVFGKNSLHVATAQEDLAYALYVYEYSSGRFYKARDHAERAIKIMEQLVPSDHLLLASAKRVKALILEEIALDTPAGQDLSEPSLLEESEALHKAALDLSMMAFGEMNVQTAKHYGNLGRLYQSMQKYQDAEKMHLKAISIKEELLGPEDYEVGLSIGHLASLYNYHMNQHAAAEKLYFRSISISLKLFGERYSGLEYDYRGLIHVFTQLRKPERAAFYNQLLHHWHDLREQSKGEQQPQIGQEQVLPLDELKAQFFSPNID